MEQLVAARGGVGTADRGLVLAAELGAGIEGEVASMAQYLAMRFEGLRLSLLLAALGFTIHASAQEKAQPGSDASEDALRSATEYVSQMELRQGMGQTLVERVEKPLLTFGDKTRDNSNGTVWAWRNGGRPLAFLEVYRGADAKARWANAVTLTSPLLVTLKTPNETFWRPERAQVAPRPIADAPPPDRKANVRLRQMKELARRFTAHEFWDPNNSRFELRLLVQPVLRYNASEAKVEDGAAFLLAHGTNPEIVLLLESIPRDDETLGWHFSAARLGSAELHLEFDGKEVWKQDRTPGVVGKPSDPYWLFMANPLPAPSQ
jgi:hypothetical protein